jgi:hypothetical protein
VEETGEPERQENTRKLGGRRPFRTEATVLYWAETRKVFEDLIKKHSTLVASPRAASMERSENDLNSQLTAMS